jgi:hypothetical protein
MTEDRSKKRSYVRVFEGNPEHLDKAINEEIANGDYIVSAVAITARGDHQLVALVAFEPPVRSTSPVVIGLAPDPSRSS